MNYWRQRYLRDGESMRAAARANYRNKRAEYAAYRNSPRGKYERQKRRAWERGVEWLFTFETWIAWWGVDFLRRGRHRGQLVMARYGDVGPYSPFNCLKITCGENVAYASQRRAA